MKLTKKRIMFICGIIAVLLVLIVIVCINRKSLKTVFEEAEEIKILSEASNDETKITNVDAFIEHLGLSQWKELATYDKKFMPMYYLSLQPTGKLVHILGADSQVAYMKVDDVYYEVSIDIYNYILSFINQ